MVLLFMKTLSFGEGFHEDIIKALKNILS